MTYGDRLEVSLACPVCARNDRTVDIGREGAVCIKDGHTFDARLEELSVEARGTLSIATYRVSYDYKEFVDAKHGTRAERFPTWGRISFVTACTACGASKQRSTQTNMVRPWSALCACGAVAYEETGQLPLFECWPLRPE